MVCSSFFGNDNIGLDLALDNLELKDSVLQDVGLAYSIKEGILITRVSNTTFSIN